MTQEEDSILEFIRVVRESLPVAFVKECKRNGQYENGEANKVQIVNEISSPILYENRNLVISKVKMSVMNAAEYGAPQLRERIFIVALGLIRNSFSLKKLTLI